MDCLFPTGKIPAMRMLVTSRDHVRMNHLKEIMTKNGLKCELRDGSLSPKATSPAYSELWMNEEDYDTGVALLTSLRAKLAVRAPMSRWLHKAINPSQDPFGQRARE